MITSAYSEHLSVSPAWYVCFKARVSRGRWNYTFFNKNNFIRTSRLEITNSRKFRLLHDDIQNQDDLHYVMLTLPCKQIRWYVC